MIMHFDRYRVTLRGNSNLLLEVQEEARLVCKLVVRKAKFTVKDSVIRKAEFSDRSNSDTKVDDQMRRTTPKEGNYASGYIQAWKA